MVRIRFTFRSSRAQKTVYIRIYPWRLTITLMNCEYLLKISTTHHQIHQIYTNFDAQGTRWSWKFNWAGSEWNGSEDRIRGSKFETQREKSFLRKLGDDEWITRERRWTRTRPKETKRNEERNVNQCCQIKMRKK